MRSSDRAILAVSAGIILYEITITRIFSVLMWYHFVSFAVALALGGMAFGSLIAIGVGDRGPDKIWEFLSRWGAFSALGCALVYFLLILVSRYPGFGYRILSPLHQTYYEPFSVGSGSGTGSFIATVTALLLFFSLPFFGGGAVFAACFEKSRNVFVTYAHSAAGSALGVVLYIAVMKLGSAPGALLFSSLVFLAGTGTGVEGRRGARVRRFLFAAVVGALLVYNYAANPADPSFVRGRYEPDILWSRWNATSRVVVFPVGEEELIRGFGEGKKYLGSAPDALGMVVDDTGYTLMFKAPDESNRESFLKFFDYNLASLPFELLGRGEALIIGPGGGKDIHAASAGGDFKVVAVELNELVVEAVENEFSSFTGRPYSGDGVKLVIAEGRSYLERESRKFDVIEMTQVFGRVPPQAGAFTLTENHLYTIESIERMLKLLKEGGVLSITRFHFEKTGPRLVKLVESALREIGVDDPSKSVLIAGSRGVMNLMAWRRIPSRDVIEYFLRLCSEKGFDVLYYPGMREENMNLIGKVAAGIIDDSMLPFDMTPPTDDRPFFYYTVKKEDFVKARFPGGKSTEERGAYLVRKAISPLGFVSFLAILISAAAAGGGSYLKRFLHMMAFFMAGLSFVFLEVLLIKKLILLLGFPVYSLSVVLLSVLLFSSAGALTFSLLNIGEKIKIITGCFALASLLLLYRFVLDGILDILLPAPLFLRVCAGFLLAGLPAFFAGVPFPSLLELYNRKKRKPMALPIFVNGIAAVAGSFLILAVSLNYGYGVLMVVTSVGYAAVAMFAHMAD